MSMIVPVFSQGGRGGVDAPPTTPLYVENPKSKPVKVGLPPQIHVYEGLYRHTSFSHEGGGRSISPPPVQKPTWKPMGIGWPLKVFTDVKVRAANDNKSHNDFTDKSVRDGNAWPPPLPPLQEMVVLLGHGMK